MKWRTGRRFLNELFTGYPQRSAGAAAFKAYIDAVLMEAETVDEAAVLLDVPLRTL